MLQKKGALLGGIIIMAAIALSGCGGSNKQSITEYINNKYDDTFTYVETSFVSLDGNVINVMYSSEKYPDDEVYVHWSEKKDGAEKFTDNYMAIVLNDEAKSKLTEVAKEVYGADAVVRCEPSPSALPEEFGAASTVEQYLGERQNDLYVEILLPYGSSNPDEVQSHIDALCQAQKKAKIYCMTRIFYLKEGYGVEDAGNKDWQEVEENSDVCADCHVDKEWNISLEYINGVEK